MDLPAELWSDTRDHDLVAQAVGLFADSPILLTDALTNSIYLNKEAEALFGERAEALVNRAASSLLGFGEKEKAPPGLIQALTGESSSWRGIASPEGSDCRTFCEASAIRREGRLICGVIRLGAAKRA